MDLLVKIIACYLVIVHGAFILCQQTKQEYNYLRPQTYFQYEIPTGVLIEYKEVYTIQPAGHFAGYDSPWQQVTSTPQNSIDKHDTLSVRNGYDNDYGGDTKESTGDLETTTPDDSELSDRIPAEVISSFLG